MAIHALEELLYMLGGLAALWLAWRALEWSWLSPRRLGRVLRAQGLRGTAYRFPAGDPKEEAERLLVAERTKPMPLQSHGISARVQPLVHSTITEHGKISMIWMGPTPSVILHDPRLVREVLSNKFEHFKKAELPSRFIKLIGQGLASHKGEKWAVHRKIINHAFHLEKLKKMLPAFTACTGELISRWEDPMGSGKAREIDVWPELQDLTGDAISRAAFGSSISEGRRIFRVQSEQIELATHMTNLYIPGYTFLPTKVNRRIKANAREVETLLKGIITKKERAMTNGHADDSDMLGLLLQSNAKESQASGSSKPMMTMDDIIGELKLFYFAGMETTSVPLTWTMIVLSMHPEWQDRAREEVLSVFGKKQQPDLDGTNQLKIVTMVLYEVLRLYPPLTILQRETYKEMELGGVRYPAGVKLLLPIVTIHHDTDVWGEDADEFRPERFAEGISKASKDAPAFFPFGWGPRICIGQNFALLEAKIALSMILQRFEFQLSPSYTHAPFPVSTLRPDHGALIKLKKI